MTSNSNGSNETMQAYTSHVAELGKRRQWGQALEVFSSMEAKSVLPDGITYGALIGACAKGSQPDRALEFFQAMQRQGVVPHLVAYNALINAVAKGNNQTVERPLEIFDDMQRQSVVPDIVTYNALAGACVKGNEPELALQVFQGMQRQSVEPTSLTARVLIGAAQRSDNPERAVEVLDALQRKGFMNSISDYNAFIIACEKGKQPQRVDEIVVAMQRQGIVPNLETYNAMISACERLNATSRALEIFQQMQRAGITPNEITYNALTSLCAKGKQVQKTLEFFQMMQNQGIVPNVIACNALISACDKANRLESALNVFHVNALRSIAPNVVSCNALINAFERTDQPDQALDVLKIMCRQGVLPNAVTYHALMTVIEKSPDPVLPSYAGYLQTLNYYFSDANLYWSLGPRSDIRNIATFTAYDGKSNKMYNGYSLGAEHRPPEELLDVYDDELQSIEEPDSERASLFDRRLCAVYKLINDFMKRISKHPELRAFLKRGVIWSKNPLCMSSAAAAKQLQQRLPEMELEIVVGYMDQDDIFRVRHNVPSTPLRGLSGEIKEKTIWGYYDKGYDKMPDFMKACVRTWQETNPDWDVRILEQKTVHEYLSDVDLPNRFMSMPSCKTASDAVRLGLLARYGGIYMDVNIVLRTSLDDWVWDDISSGKKKAAVFYHSHYGLEEHGSKDYIESWWLATKANNPYFILWRDLFRELFHNRVDNTLIVNHPLYQGLDLSGIARLNSPTEPGVEPLDGITDYREYLAIHAMCHRIIEKVPELRAQWENDWILTDAAMTAFRLQTVAAMSKVTVTDMFLSEDPQVMKILEGVPLVKFTQPDYAPLMLVRPKSRLKNPDTLFQRLLRSEGVPKDLSHRRRSPAPGPPPPEAESDFASARRNLPPTPHAPADEAEPA